MRKVFDSINQINLKKDENRNLVYIPLKNKLYIYENRQGVFEKLSEITNEDEIMNFHLLKNSDGNFILISKSDKKISIYNKEGEKLNEVIHYKKVTNSLTVEESNSDYLILSDKFGEIYIKNLSEDFTQPPIILYGHSDPIHMMKISPFNNMIVSADTFGKIKICEFPNIFNFMSVILYKNEEIKFLDFFSNRELLILNSDGEIHIWSLENFELKSKCSLNEILEKEHEITSIIPFGDSKIYIETSKFYYILNRSDNKFVKSLEIEKKNEKIIKSFFLLQKSEVKILGIDEEGKLNYVI